MKHILNTIFLNIIFLSLVAQNPHRPNYNSETSKQEANTSEAKVEYSLSRIDLVGYHFEKSINNQGTVVFGLQSNFLYPYIANNSLRLTYGFSPKLELSFRSYYSLVKRKSLNRPYKNNTGPYISGRVEVQKLLASFQDGFDEYSSTIVDLLWGFQDNELPLSFNFEIDPNFGFTNVSAPNFYFNNPFLVLLSKLKFGFLLNR